METKRISSKVLKMAALAVATIALACVALVLPAAAFADEPSAASASASASASAEPAAAESSGSSAPVDAVASAIRGGLPMMGNDYVWFGRDLELSNGEIANDLIAAGQVANVQKTTAAGDFRIAAQDISIKDSTAGQNITVAGQNVSIHDANAKAIAVAGNVAYVSGTCDELVVYAETAYIDGTVNGDVVVGANTVEIGKNARIKGTLRVSAASEPVMQGGAEVADVEFTHSESSVSTGHIGAVLAELSATIFVFLAVMGVIGTLVVAVVSEWLFRRQTAGAADMIRNRTGATIGSGIVGALVAPLVVIVLLFLGITLPMAGGVAFALFAMTSVAAGFAGASLFKLAFPNLGRFKCALAGGAIMGVAGVIPFLGSLVHAAAFMYLLGYVLQSIYLGMREPAPVGPMQ